MTNKPDALPVVAWTGEIDWDSGAGAVTSTAVDNAIAQIAHEANQHNASDWWEKAEEIAVNALQTALYNPKLLADVLTAIGGDQRDAELSELREQKELLASGQQGMLGLLDAASNALHAKCQEVVALQAELAAMRSQKPVAKVLSEQEMLIGFDRRHGPVIWFGGYPAPGMLYAAPVSAPGQVAAEVVPGCVSISIDLLKDLRNAAPSDWKATIDCVLNGALLATSQGEA